MHFHVPFTQEDGLPEKQGNPSLYKKYMKKVNRYLTMNRLTSTPVGVAIFATYMPGARPETS